MTSLYMLCCRSAERKQFREACYPCPADCVYRSQVMTDIRTKTGVWARVDVSFRNRKAGSDTAIFNTAITDETQSVPISRIPPREPLILYRGGANMCLISLETPTKDCRRECTTVTDGGYKDVPHGTRWLSNVLSKCISLLLTYFFSASCSRASAGIHRP